jgi:molybdopterin converting factor small subunit
MTVTVALYAGFARYLPPGAQNRRAVLTLAEGATVLDAMRRLGMPEDLPCIPVVDGRRATPDTALREGETLSLFPPLAGGATPNRLRPMDRGSAPHREDIVPRDAGLSATAAVGTSTCA